MLIGNDVLTDAEVTGIETLWRSQAGENVIRPALKKVATTGSLVKDSTTATLASTTGIAADDWLVFEENVGHGKVGSGGAIPAQTFPSEAAVLAAKFSRPGSHVRVVSADPAQDGKVYKAKVDQALCIGSIAGGVLTVTAMRQDKEGRTGSIGAGANIGGTDVFASYITSQLTGTPGGVGTYAITGSQTLSSRDIDTTGGGGYYAWDPSVYYTRYCQPRAFSAQVQSVDSAKQVTLKTAPVASATNTNVYSDAWPALNAINGPDDLLVDLTALSGTYRLSKTLAVTGKRGCRIKGPGRDTLELAKPRGTGGSAL